MANLKRSFFSNVKKYQEDHPSSERGCAFVAVYIHALQNADDICRVKHEKTIYKKASLSGHQ